MKRVFVDTGVFYAHLVAEEQDHSRAKAFFQQAASEGWDLITTNAVVFETYALLVNRARNGGALARGLLDDLDGGFCRVERLTKRDEERAKGIVRDQDDKDYSLCDAASFALMERMKIKDALAFDGHFSQYGRFVILR